MTITKPFPSSSLFNGVNTSRQHEDLVAAFLDFQCLNYSAGTRWQYAGAVRHFLLWLDKICIPLANIDDIVVKRFKQHKCNCPRYRPKALENPIYVSHVSRFVRFLENCGVILVINDLSNITEHLAAFAIHLESLGYSTSCQTRYYSEAEHFACWLRSSRTSWGEVDDATINLFVQHDCYCPICRKRGLLTKRTGPTHRRRGSQRFILFLQERKVIPAVPIKSSNEDPKITAFRIWLKQHIGATDHTIRRYVYEVARWLSDLGTDTSAYNATTIRNVVLNQSPTRSHQSIKLTVTVLRSYLRFLATEGECRPELVHAVLSVPTRRFSTLPRYVNPEEIERIINSCDTSTPVRIRDRAIILLLARLGLRAGDILQLRLADIDWVNAIICVHGKSRRPVRLPLPQDAGDAVLAYLEEIRPKVMEERVFLRIQAPFTPFKSSAEISGIVARVLARSGIQNIPTGSHVFRHSLATAKLRAGGSLESVGTILRHRSPNTTAIYAKVDTNMLKRVAQPWPGETSC